MLRRITLLAILLLTMAFPLSAQMSSSAGHYTLHFEGVDYDVDANTSTWTYRLVWDGESPSLSHFGIGLCDSLVAADILAYSPPEGFTFGSDPSTTRPGCYSESDPFRGVKWDTDTAGTFSFTLRGLWAVGSTDWVAKAGSENSFPTTWCNRGTIYGPSCTIAEPAIQVEKECVADAFVGPVPFSFHVTNSGNVPLTDVVVNDPQLNYSQTIASLAVGETKTLTTTANLTTPGAFTNQVSANGSYWGWNVSDSDSCTTTLWELQVSKTANTSYKRTNSWSIDKSILPSFTANGPLEICSGQSATVPFKIDVERTFVDSDFNVSGVVTIYNPAPIPAPVVSVADTLSGSGTVMLSCAGSYDAGGTTLCSYSVSVGDASSRTNTATVTLASGSQFSAQVPVNFGAPTVINPVANVADTVSCPQGFQCTPSSGSWQLTDSGSIDFDVVVANENALCDTYFTLGNKATLTHDGGSTEDSTSIEFYSCGCSTGCTLTIGYWKTHAGFNGNNADRVSQYLTLFLGTPYAGKSVAVTTPSQAVTILSKNGEASNGINKLRAQLLAAKLNIANGASGSDVSDEIAQADAILELTSDEDWNALSKAAKKTIVSLASVFDEYNNGLIGPGHCD